MDKKLKLDKIYTNDKKIISYDSRRDVGLIFNLKSNYTPYVVVTHPYLNEYNELVWTSGTYFTDGISASIYYHAEC